MNIQNCYTDLNASIWDKWSLDGDPWTLPISHADYNKAKQGDYHMVLTCQRDVPKEWYLPIQGKKLLGLASGGGQQMPIMAALGADVTVMDYSDRQLAAEQMVAEREHYSINLVKSDMSKLFPFDDGYFDIIFNPVSVCYVEDVEHIWKECYRVLKPNGVLLSGFGNPFQSSLDSEGKVTYKLPRNPLKDCTIEEINELLVDDGLIFSHSLDTLIGGQGRNGLHVIDLYEDYHFGSTIAPTYIATRSIKLCSAI